MKTGLSSYSLSRAISAGEMDILTAIQWIAENGGQHVEIVPAGFTLTENDTLVKAIVAKAAAAGIAISSYTIGASFINKTDADHEQEIERVKKEVDIAAALGVKLMRHDAASRPIPETSLERFEADLPKVTAACRSVADYASQYGITTSVENHGYHFQGSERVQRLVLAVGRDNFRTTVDIGNFLCADEDPSVAVRNNIKYASMIHLKDFYRRAPEQNPGEGWFKSRAGYNLRGAIVGHGDINLPAILQVIKDSGYDGFLSIEFEGMEDCRLGSRIGMQNTLRFLNELK